MEEIMDFDLWIESQKNLVPKYYLIYNDVGIITGIYPESAALNILNKVDLPQELKDKISAGEKNLDLFRVDVITKRLVEIETIDFFPYLIRATEINYSSDKNFEIYLVYDRLNSSVTVELSSNLGGTRFDDTERRFLYIHPDLKMRLYFTDYNDPNILHDTIDICVQDLFKGSVSTKVCDLPNRFGIFTKRLFDRYGLEVNENN